MVEAILGISLVAATGGLVYTWVSLNRWIDSKDRAIADQRKITDELYLMLAANRVEIRRLRKQIAEQRHT